jgi:hypothetical protein
MTDNNNPLKDKIRNIKIYVRLPSAGRYNKDGVEFANNGLEVPVRAMTAKDELLLRNPDALLNGDAVEKLVASCVPEVHNTRETPMNDIDVILLGIKYATYGDKFDFSVNCPKCATENKIEKSIRDMLDSATDLPEFHSLKIENDLELFLKPYNFENSNKANLVDFESQKRLAMIQNTYQRLDSADQKQLDNAEKVARSEMSQLFNGMADFTLNLMIDSIQQIVLTKKTSDDSEMKSVVTNPEHIKEYVWNLDPVSVDKIKEKMKEVMKYGINKTTHIACVNQECKHEWDMEVGFDQSNFFAPTSQA